MRPVRISSEGPEVVPQTPDKYSIPYSQRPYHQRGTLYQKQIEVKGQIPLFPLPPNGEASSRFSLERHDQSFGRRYCGLFTILLAIGAFLLGGGIGGGIGGVYIAKERSKISSLTSSLAIQPTVTVSASSAPTACFIDQAGCPNINNTTYTSTVPGYTFLQICETDIISSSSESIDISSNLQTSWNACMDSCASYNQNVKQGGCMGATWQIFSASNPSQNLVCFLKNSTSARTRQPSGDDLCSGVLISS